MITDNTKHKNEIMNVCKKINEDIINSYGLLKNSDFYRAWKYQYKYDGKDSDCFNELSMRDGKFNFRFRTTLYEDEEDKWQEAIDYFNKNGKSYGELRSFYDRIRLGIHETNNGLVERLWIIRKGSFSGIGEFADFCIRGDDSKSSIESILKVLSTLPTDMVKAHEQYAAIIKDKEMDEEGKYKNFLNELIGNLDKFKKYVDYERLYLANPQLFLDRFKTLSREEQKSIISKLLKIPIKQANPELDKYIEENFPGLIAESFRENAEIPGGKNGKSS